MPRRKDHNTEPVTRHSPDGKSYTSDSKECKNCLYYNVQKIGCKHPTWKKCIVRDSDEFVIDYLYHEYHYR